LKAGVQLKTLKARAHVGPRFLTAAIAPARGMMLVQARVRLADDTEVDLVLRPPADIVARFGGPEDFCGNLSFSFGAAVLLPYANRIRGTPAENGREIVVSICGEEVRLPANWGGRRFGAERYAMHGLILNRVFAIVDETEDRIRGVLRAGDFAGHWVSSTDVEVGYRLEPERLSLTVQATNAGEHPLPMSIGWHPYFNIGGKGRAAARLQIPASGRLEVNNSDELLPSGRVLPVAGTAYDFAAPNGRALDTTFLDDCFVDLQASGARAVASVSDLWPGLGVRLNAAAPPVRAFQVYAPSDQDFLAIEPQFNWTDPFWSGWRGAATGYVLLQPGEQTIHDVQLELFAS
jgi:aldose 1-epimerase